MVGASVGGYAALRAGLALSAIPPLHRTARHARPVSTPISILAFGPQVFLDPTERRALDLPAMFFDFQLNEMHCEASLAKVDVLAAHAMWTQQAQAERADAPTASSCMPTIEVHVGGCAVGDVREAALLREALTLADGPRVAVHVHEGLSHALVKDLRDAGVLDGLLKRMM